MDQNAVMLTGTLLSAEPLRYTPAGVPLVSCRLRHASRQVEAGVARQVECEIAVIAMGPVALGMSALREGDAVRVGGFLNRRSRSSTQVVLHAASVEPLAAGTIGAPA